MEHIELSRRVERLERQQRLIKRVAASVLLVVLVGVLLGQAAPSNTAKTVQAEKFELVDAQGKVRASLALSQNEPMLTFFNAEKKRTVLLRSTPDGASLTLYCTNTKGGASMNTAGMGPCVAMWGLVGKQQARLGLSKDGPSMWLRDTDGNIKVHITLPEEKK